MVSRFFVLANGEPKTITTLAKEIHHSHPSVSNIIKEMSAQGFIDEIADPSDGRKNFITLSNKGYDVSNQLVEQYADVTSAINNIAKQTTRNLWQAIEEWEFLLAEKSLFKRVEEEKNIVKAKRPTLLITNQFINIYSNL